MGFFKKVLNAIQNRLNKLFSPPNEKIDLHALRWTICGVFVTFGIGVYAIWIAKNQLLTQLQELNAKAEIHLKGYFQSTNIDTSSEDVSVVRFIVVPRNTGETNSTNWDAVLIFCKDIDLKNSTSTGWEYMENNQFSFHSTQPVLKEQASFQVLKDSIGSFDMSLSNTEFAPGNDNEIPIGIYITYGDGVDQINEFLFFDKKQNKILNKPLETNNGKILTDLKGCWDQPQE